MVVAAGAGDLERARAALAEGALARALELARGRLAENPRDAEARAIAAEAALGLGRLDEAERHLDRLARLDPQRAGLETALGRVALARGVEFAQRGQPKLASGAFEQALAQFDRALERDPRDGRAREGRARALRGLGRSEEALEAFRAWSEADPEAFEPRAAMAELFLQAGQLDQALEQVRQLPASTPGPVRERLAYEAAKALYIAGRADEAQPLREALRAEDSRRRLLDALDALFRLEDPFAAAEAFAAAFEQAPDAERLSLAEVYHAAYQRLSRRWRERHPADGDRLAAPAMELLPRYPARARALGFGARVFALVMVEADGRAGEVRILASDLPRFGRVYRKEFEAAVREALARSTFQPAEREGRPLRFPLVVLVEFRPD